MCPVFEYAVTLKPTQQAAKNGEREVIIVPPTSCVAKDEAEARTIAARAIPAAHAAALDRTEVVVRPF